MAFFKVPDDAKDFYGFVLDSVEGVMQDEVDEFDKNVCLNLVKIF